MSTIDRPPISGIIGGARRELLALPWLEYCSLPALNGSVLVAGRKSMLHLKYAWDHGGEDTEAMQFGRLLHCLLFEPAEVENRYRPWASRRAGNEYELFCAEAAAAGAEVVRQSGEYSLERAIEAAHGFLRNSRVQALISAGQAEQAVLWTEGDVQCKGRLDWVSTSQHVLTDLKSANDISDKLFGAAFFRYGYDIKLGLYRRWLQGVTNDRWPVEVIALESKPPYDVATIPIPDAVLDAGVDKALAIIADVRQAIATGQWPGVAGNELYPLCVPYWEMEETEEFQG